ncbi:MAG: drug resistance transporter, EmrB/QacA subfamily [Frankiales bacterium]|jgi:EmrB/QacA subfamily drug resistance transporter|nr:drug resistance transporter, EmrB/QacA subfamily [Frankiales bacterium]
MTASTTSPGQPEAAGPGSLTHRQVLVVLSGLLLGMFLASLDQTIVSTAMKTIGDRLNGQTAQAWVTTAYLVTSTVSTPLYGKLSDQYGRKPFFLFAIAIFVVGSMLCGTANSMYTLAGYRAIQGIGAGGLMSLAFAIVGDLVPPRERGRYQAYFMSVFAVSSVAGPVLGGFFAGQQSILGIDGWRWIFYINVPIGVLALFVVLRNLNLPQRRSAHRIDFLGAGLLTAGVVPLLLVAEKGREWGWGSGLSLGLIAVGVVALVLFVPRQAQMGEEAILPLRVFRNRVFTVSSAVSFLVGAAMFGGLTSLPLYLQIVRGESPTRAGLQLIPLMVGIIVTSAVSGRIMMKTGRYKIFPILGTAVMFASMLMFSTLSVDTPLWQTMTFMAVMGGGLGLSMQTLVISVQNALPPRDMGVATSSVTFFRSMGGTFGVAIALAILFGSLIGNIRDRAVQANLPAAVLAKFQNATALNDTSVIGTLPPAVRRVVLEGFADSMDTVFLTVAVLLIPAFVLTFFIKEVPLRAQSGIAAAHEDATSEAKLDTVKTETAVL